MKRTLIFTLLVLSWTIPAVAQGAAVQPRTKQAEELLKLIRLPRTAQDARDTGIPADQVRSVLEGARGRRLPGGEIQTLLEEATQATREHGPIDNFGAFVQSRLDQGLRGRDLAAAIRAEHAARGKGKGPNQVQGKGKDARPGADRPGKPGSDEGRTRPRGASDDAKHDTTGEPPRGKKQGSGSGQGDERNHPRHRRD